MKWFFHVITGSTCANQQVFPAVAYMYVDPLILNLHVCAPT